MSTAAIYAGVSALIRDNYQTADFGLPTGEQISVNWTNEAGDEGRYRFEVQDGFSQGSPVDLSGASDEMVYVQVDCVVPAGDYSARARAMMNWLQELFFAGRRIAGGTVAAKPFPGPPDNNQSEYWIPVTITVRSVT